MVSMSRPKSTVACLTVLSIVAVAAFAGCASAEPSEEDASDSVQPITAVPGAPRPGTTNVQVACPRFTKQGASTPVAPGVGPGVPGSCEPYADGFGQWHIQGFASTCMCTYSTDDPANATSCASKGYLPGVGPTACPTWGLRSVACRTTSGGSCQTAFRDLGSSPSAAAKQDARLWCQNSMNAQCRAVCGQGPFPNPTPNELSCRK